MRPSENAQKTTADSPSVPRAEVAAARELVTAGAAIGAAAGVALAGKGAGVRVDSAGRKSEVGLMVRVGVGVAEVEDKNKIPAMAARASANTATTRTTNPIKVRSCLRGGR